MNTVTITKKEYLALKAVAEAADKFYEFYFNDLAKNNPGFLAKLTLNDYGAMNDAYCALTNSRNALAKLQLLPTPPPAARIPGRTGMLRCKRRLTNDESWCRTVDTLLKNQKPATSHL